MSALAHLTAASARDAYRHRAFVLVMLAFVLFFVALTVALVCVLAIVPQTRSAAPDPREIARFLSLLVYGSGFIAMGMNLIVFTSNILAKEKAQRIYETMLGGPVAARELWLAKSLGLFLPGCALCEIISLAAFFGVESLVVAPAIGFLAAPGALLGGLVLVPLLYFPIYCLALLVALQGNPVSGNILANVVFSALLALAGNLVARARLDMGSPAFALGNLGLAAAFGILVLALLPRLSKERIVLSCRS